MKRLKIVKRLALAATLLLFFSAYGFSQGTTFGLKGGFNLSNLSLEGNDDSNLKPGFHAGGFAEIPLSGSFAIMPEVQFSTKGTKWERDLLTQKVKLQANLNYIEMPVSFVYYLARDFDFQLGPYVGFLMDANYKVVSGADSRTTVIDYKMDKDVYNSTDFGIQGGMRFHLNPIFLGFGYKYGLSQVAKEGTGDARIFFGDAGNRLIQVYAGIKF